MSRVGERTDEQREIARLVDELEQAHTALEASNEEVSRLVESRDGMLADMAAQGRELQAANTAYGQAVAARPGSSRRAMDEVRTAEADEELRVAFEELQVLTEELEVANNSLHETNRVLDRRVAERTDELAAKNDALTQSELRFRALVEGMPQLVWRSAPGGDWTWASPQWSRYTGQSTEESLGQGWLRACHPDDRAAVEAAWTRAAEGRVLDYETRIFHAGEGRYRHHQTRATPARSESGDLFEWLGTCTDVDDLVTLQARQAVLVAELQHRTRNLMGVVRSTIQRTLEGGASLEQFRSRIGARMDSLTRVQSLLSRRGEGRVAFDSLLREEIGAHVELDGDGRGEQVSISGPPDVQLYSTTVQTLALGLHELMTNAVKYGALSSAGGRLEVGWSVEAPAPGGGKRLRIDWRESGVHPMPSPSDPPRGGGYGRELIEAALPYQLGAETTFVFGEDGVRCTIAVAVADD